jgi:hypothetical protein
MLFLLSEKLYHSNVACVTIFFANLTFFVKEPVYKLN